MTGESYMRDPGHRVVPCTCACGTKRDVLVFALRRAGVETDSKSSSCGCHKAERAARQAEAFSVTHGYARAEKHPLYRLWLRIRKRCNNPAAHNYKHYGGRGIKVFEPWVNDAEAFITWVLENLGERPPGHTLDRIDNDGHYEPGNLQWATMAEQNAKKARPNIYTLQHGAYPDR